MKFTGLDTETQDGKAVLVCTPGEFHEPDAPLDLFRWLTRWTRDFVAYNLDFDASALIKWLPKTCWTDLAFKNFCQWQDFKIFYLPGKKMVIGRGRTRVRIYDAFPFFQKSLEKAARETLGVKKAKVPIPHAWLHRMGALRDGGGWRWARVIKYCQRDAALCEALFGRIRESFERLNLDFSDPISPGSLAGKLWGPRVKPSGGWDERPFKQVFFGGRIESFQRGNIEGPLALCDLASAYPWAQSRLIDPRGLSRGWIRGEPPADAKYGAVLVEVDSRTWERFGPFPVRRKDGSVHYPVGNFTCWTTLPEFRAARPGPWGIRPLEGYYLWGDGPLYFPEIPAMFKRRLLEPEVSTAIKLVLNASYGKLAARISKHYRADVVDRSSLRHRGDWYESRSQDGPITRYLLASHITGAVRARLLTDVLVPAIRDGWQDKVIFLATDGVLLEGPALKGAGGVKRLGAWGVEHFTRAVVVGSGVYSLYEGRTRKLQKVRGFAWKGGLSPVLRGRKRPVISIPVLERESLLIAVQRDSPAFNVLRDARRYLDVNFDTKRIYESDFRGAGAVLRERQSSWAPLMVERSIGETNRGEKV